MSEYGVLPAGTSYEDAVRGDAVVFKFAGGVTVSPGQTYRLELVRVSGGSEARLCIGAKFAAIGGGRPK